MNENEKREEVDWRKLVYIQKGRIFVPYLPGARRFARSPEYSRSPSRTRSYLKRKHGGENENIPNDGTREVNEPTGERKFESSNQKVDEVKILKEKLRVANQQMQRMQKNQKKRVAFQEELEELKKDQKNKNERIRMLERELVAKQSELDSTWHNLFELKKNGRELKKAYESFSQAGLHFAKKVEDVIHLSEKVEHGA